VNINTDYVVTFNDDAGKVRLTNPPLEFDEKGRYKKPTDEDLARLQGDDPDEKKLTGYKSEFSEVMVGDTATVSLSTPKTDPKKSGKEETDTKEDRPDVKQPDRWVAAGQLVGKVTKVENNSSTRKVTIRVTKQQNTTDKNAKDQTTAQIIDPVEKQATLIVIGPRPMDTPPPTTTEKNDKEEK
jgi:hypothetical protein